MSVDAFPHVFAPLTLRHRALRARINFGAHTTNMGEAGLPSERHIAYYRERALGGAGMIVVEPMPVHPTGVLTRGNFRVDDDTVVPHFRRLTDTCREAGDVVMIHQLYHVGQHGDADNSFAPNWSPSGLPSYHDADGSHAVTEAEIEQLLDGFVRAASRARASGFDGVELFAAYHALIDQFWTPWSNRRTDRWGGSLENRVRFSRTLLERIRTACGDDFIIGLAVNADPASPASLRLEELQEIVAWHDSRALMDYVTCGTGSYFDFFSLMPTSLYPARLGEPYAAALKAVTAHARVQAESHIRTPEAAEELLAVGHADMVSIVRGQIADPHLVAKARDGRAGDVRPCISCNQLCWGRRSRDYWISCLINPSAGREWEWGGDRFEAASAPRQVLVVGGGPAGLEAARVAAERGHHVTLAEADHELGGQWRLAGRQPSRTQVLDHLAWYGRQLDRLGVEVCLGQSVDGEAVRASGADEVVVATGAAPARARVPARAPPRRPPAGGGRFHGRQHPRRPGGLRRAAGTRPAAGRPRRLAGHRNGDVPAGGRLPGDAGDLGAGGGHRAVPQRGRRSDPRSLRPGRWRDDSAHRRAVVGPRRHGAALDADRRRAPVVVRLAGRRGDTDASDGPHRRARPARGRVPPDRRLRGRPAGQPGHLRRPPPRHDAVSRSHAASERCQSTAAPSWLNVKRWMPVTPSDSRSGRRGSSTWSGSNPSPRRSPPRPLRFFLR